MAHGHGSGHSNSNEKWPNEIHIAPVSSYIKVFVALIILTVCTVGTAKGIKLNPPVLNLILAMVIAVLKASLVVMFFMHQKYETKMNKAIFISGFVFLALLLGFTGIDDLTRKTLTADPAIKMSLEKKRQELTGEKHEQGH